MVSRKTTIAIAEAYLDRFSHVSHNHYGTRNETVYNELLYDFLYEEEYEAWFCNLVTRIGSIRSLKEFFLKIHTGESLSTSTPDWTWQKRQALGQQYLAYLASDFVSWFQENKTEAYTAKRYQKYHDSICRGMELDGFLYRENAFHRQEADVLDVEAERGLIAQLYTSLQLNERDANLKFLELAETHYLGGLWSDCIGNARKFLEGTLREVANKLFSIKPQLSPAADYNSPVSVRQYLEHAKLLEKKERETLDKIYGLLSHTGAHPYMAEKDQARLLRQLSLTTIQFVLLRLEGALK